MAELRIEYCYECMYFGKALEIAGQALSQFSAQLASLEIIPGTDGVFTVSVDDQIVYKMTRDPVFPAMEQIWKILVQRLAPTIS